MSSSLRIAFFVGSFPVVSETFILRQITGLIDLGHSVDIFSDTRGDRDSPVHPEVKEYDLLRRTTFMEMPVEAAPWEMPIYPLLGRTWAPGQVRSVPNWVRMARALPLWLRSATRAPRTAASVLKRSEYAFRADSLSGVYRLARLSAITMAYDVVHAHFGPVGNSFRFVRQLWGAPLVVSFHGYDFCTAPRKEGPGMYRKLFETADCVTVNSDYTGRGLVQLGCPSEKLYKLPVGLDPEQFRFLERRSTPGAPVRLLSVARLVEIKGHEYIIRALRLVRAAHPNLCYDVVGDGPLRARLEAVAKEEGVGDMVTFHGAKTGAVLRRFFDEAHVFVLGSVSVRGDEEGQGLALQEAQACGLPVVATQHGAFPEGVLDGQSGLLVPQGDVVAMASRLHEVLSQPERWPAMGRAGRAFVESKFNIRLLNRHLIDLYRELSAPGNGRRVASSQRAAENVDGNVAPE